MPEPKIGSIVPEYVRPQVNLEWPFLQFSSGPFPDSTSACRRLCQRWSAQVGASRQLPTRGSLGLNLLHPDRVAATVIAELIVTGAMSRISEETPDSRVILPCRLRWNLEAVVLL